MPVFGHEDILNIVSLSGQCDRLVGGAYELHPTESESESATRRDETRQEGDLNSTAAIDGPVICGHDDDD